MAYQKNLARALAKNPKLLLCDEPTGALDSNTGKQVFDTLKKLSEKKPIVKKKYVTAK